MQSEIEALKAEVDRLKCELAHAMSHIDRLNREGRDTIDRLIATHERWQREQGDNSTYADVGKAVVDLYHWKISRGPGESFEDWMVGR